MNSQQSRGSQNHDELAPAPGRAAHCKLHSHTAPAEKCRAKNSRALTPDEVERLIEAAKANRHGHRDGLMVLLAYRHGLRAAEVTDLRWEQIDFKSAILSVRRLKAGTPATHPLTGRKLRELRRHQWESGGSPFVFVSERGAPLTAPGFSRMIERAAAAANLGIKAHAHMLRHACGYKLANDGHDTRSLQAYYLGHRNIQNTTRYTALAPDRFKCFWKD